MMRLGAAVAAAALLLVLSAAAAAVPPTAAAAALPEQQDWQTEQQQFTSDTTSRVMAQAVTCPSTVEVLSPGVDLATKAANKTYLLPAGNYKINSTITLNDSSTVTCYQGLDNAAGVPGKQAVRILVDPAVGNAYAFDVREGAKLQLLNLLLDGQDSSSGMSIVKQTAALTTVEVTDVTIQRFKRQKSPTLSPDGGGAVAVRGTSAKTFTRTDFLNNTCVNCTIGGGALILFGSDTVFDQVNMQGNTATGDKGNGGAMAILFGKATFRGSNTISNNVAFGAEGQGGGIWMGSSSEVKVEGGLCASSNTATAGGAVYIRPAGSAKGILRFGDSAQVEFGLNRPNAVDNKGTVQCGSGAPFWGAGEYDITGPACACNETFVNNTAANNLTCNGCGGREWDVATCACVPAQCSNLGQGCCQLNGLYSPAGTVCRSVRDQCDKQEICSGSSGTCPTDAKARDGTRCRKTFLLNPEQDQAGYSDTEEGIDDAVTVAWEAAAEAQYHHDEPQDPDSHYPQQMKYSNHKARQGGFKFAECGGHCKAGVCRISQEHKLQCIARHKDY